MQAGNGFRTVHTDKFAAEGLVQRFGTPLYVYDRAEFRNSIDGLQSALPTGARLLYSVKANPHPALISEAIRCGLGLEISSSGELEAVLAGGADPGQCVYTGPGKGATELRLAFRSGIGVFNVESLEDARQLRSAADAEDIEASALLRLNSGRPRGGSGLRMMGGSSQFGVDMEDRAAVAEILKVLGRTKVVGIHFFSVSNIASVEALLAEFEEGLRIADAIEQQYGLSLTVLDLGGGFAAPYASPGEPRRHDSLAGGLAALLERYRPGWEGDDRQRIWFESGRALAGSCGTLYSSVVDVKENSGKTFVVLDAGTNVLGGMTGLGRLLAPSVTPLSSVGSGSAESAESTEVILVGPLCTPLDLHNRRLLMPRPRVGDVLAVPNVGAYGLTASLLGFLSRPIASEVVVDGDRMVSARRLEISAKELE